MTAASRQNGALSLTQTAGHQTPLALAAAAVAVTTASNNTMKGVYALFLSDSRTGWRGMVCLTCLALLGLAPLLLLL